MDRISPQGGPVPGPPRLRSTWTWVWLVFAVLVIVLTVIGMYQAGSAYGIE